MNNRHEVIRRDCKFNKAIKWYAEGYSKREDGEEHLFYSFGFPTKLEAEQFTARSLGRELAQGALLLEVSDVH